MGLRGEEGVSHRGGYKVNKVQLIKIKIKNRERTTACVLVHSHLDCGITRLLLELSG